MDSVWSSIVDQLGYRAPLTDGTRGGSPLFDVYLKDLGGDIYGFCAGEKQVKKRTGSGYCVLDNDFAAAQFPTGTPTDNLTVTAAHEFFHAVQYAYDYAEDPWMMEATATWMEERIATQVNDNRQYFPWSQIYAPYVPLDAFSNKAGYQYGNWVFWEYLSNNYGIGIVKKAWNEAGSLKKDGGKYSITALQKVLRKKGGLTKVYAKFAAGNLTPAVNYPEGAEYPFPKVRGGKKLSKGKRTKRVRHEGQPPRLRVLRLRTRQGPVGQEVEAVAGRQRSRQAHLAVRCRRGLPARRQAPGQDGAPQPRRRRPEVGHLRQPQGECGLGDARQRLHPLQLRQEDRPGLPGQAARRQAAVQRDGPRHEALIASRAWSAATHSATSSDTETGRSPVGTADQVSARSSV